MSLSSFIESALPTNPLHYWDASEQKILAGLLPPDAIFGRRAALARADINQQWVEWFVQGISDPYRHATKGSGYAHIFSETIANLIIMFPALTQPERRELGAIISKKILFFVNNLKAARERILLDKKSRRILLDIAGDHPRCWICGFPFSEEAIDAFSEIRPLKNIPLPDFIDILKPVGLNPQDLRIEIEHIYPLSKGGTNQLDNLRLGCGWCNRHKSSSISLYEAEAKVQRNEITSTYFASLPRPFWVVRTLATQRYCEHPAGCSCTASTSELTVSLSQLYGAPTPTNLITICKNHDNLAEHRILPRRVVASAWGIS
ncbi:HNH endonuclease [Janthinobacterium sp.]|uniref:HNH endonuclease n=1 Tax=Janthinobacterium sp. TaxID=1871054 RepID=UPI00260ACADD|nr:HNH endonuclease [Janthinobacterium sp.]